MLTLAHAENSECCSNELVHMAHIPAAACSGALYLSPVAVAVYVLFFITPHAVTTMWLSVAYMQRKRKAQDRPARVKSLSACKHARTNFSTGRTYAYESTKKIRV
jgi:hypothetical protein